MVVSIDGIESDSPDCVVEVFGEGDRRQPEVHCLRAGALHRAPRGVPTTRCARGCLEATSRAPPLPRHINHPVLHQPPYACPPRIAAATTSSTRRPHAAVRRGGL